MALADKIKANYRGNAKPKKLKTIPEAWGIEVYIFPQTLGQMIDIQSEENPIRKAIRTLVVRGKDANNARVFSDEDEIALTNYGVGDFGAGVLLDVYKEIGEIDGAEPTTEETEGK